jgi:hypothetical protein
MLPPQRWCTSGHGVTPTDAQRKARTPMSRTCTICFHREHAAIDAALVCHAASYRSIAKRFSVGHLALMRHEKQHLAHTIGDSQELASMLSAANLTAKVSEWHDRMEQQYSRADTARDVRGAALVARTGLAAIDSFARLGMLSDLGARLAALEQEKQSEDSDVPADPA